MRIHNLALLATLSLTSLPGLAQSSPDITSAAFLAELGIDPSRTYTPEEQQAFIQAAAVKLGGQVVADADGGQVIVTTQPADPQTSISTAPPPVEVLPGEGPMPQGTDFAMTYTREESFGNDTFGGGYSISASVQGRDSIGSQARRITADASGRTTGVVFSKSFTIVEATASASAEAGKPSLGTASLYAFGNEVWKGQFQDSFNMPEKDWARDLGPAWSQTIYVYGVPVNIAVQLSGGLTLGLSGDLSASSARLTATPGAYVQVNASVGIGGDVASAGIYGGLRIIHVRIPTTGRVVWPDCQLLWNLTVDLSLSTLDGVLGVFAKLKTKILWFEINVDVKRELFKWTGFTKTINLYSVDAQTDLGICEF